MSGSIIIKGARVNNLKNIDLEIPRDKLVVITGVSGSGKSSIAFETLFAEGQRRYVESLSSFARQFLGRISKPDVDEISGIPPAVAIEQKVNTTNPRSTVGITTELYDYLRLLFAKIGKTYSPVSSLEVKIDTKEDIINHIKSIGENKPIYILFPIKKYDIDYLLGFKESGYSRLFCNNQILKIDSVISSDIEYSKGLFLLIDRLFYSDDEDLISRIYDSLESALNIVDIDSNFSKEVVICHQDGEMFYYSSFSGKFERDGILFEPPTEPLFNYNNPLGACQTCSGYGRIVGIDESLVIPDTSLCVYKEAIACWRGEIMSSFYRDLVDNSEKFDFPVHKPYRELSQDQKDLLWQGNSYFTGINDFFKMVEANRYKIQYRYMLSRYSGKTICPDCNGKRLKSEALYIRIAGRTIVDLLDMSIEDLSIFMDNLILDDYTSQIADRIIKEIRSRLKGLMDVGLPYLTLNRLSNTLSGGESQRINLISSLSGGLVGTLYILDEPSIGLHSRDTQRLIDVLQKLRDAHNTVLVVEHDQEIMRAADYLIDIGPMAGSLGGEVIFAGEVNPNNSTHNKLNNRSKSLTLDFLEGRERIDIPGYRRKWSNYITVSGASENNLKNIEVKFPLNVLTVITGVSGSGKSTLVKSVLYNHLNREINQKGDKPGAFDTIKGDLSKITAIEYIDQNPIGRSSRSNAVTYLKIYDEIRKLFSEQPYAKMNGYGHSHFSFNIDGGRCPECMGEGMITIEMQFMADVKMICESCEGRRFKSDILEVKYKGLSINDVLNLSVDEAIEFFSTQPESSAKRIADKLEPLKVVGLSYIKLGQSSSTLSGGESQRVKLASFLSKEGTSESILFIFDEPTTGLHFYDIKKLLYAFNALIDKGHSIILIEHNLDIIKCADWVIDLGPEGGKKGGYVVFAGVPEDLINDDKSYTAKALKQIM